MLVALKDFLNKKIVVKFDDGQEIIGTLKSYDEKTICVENDYKKLPEVYFVSALKLIRLYEEKR